MRSYDKPKEREASELAPKPPRMCAVHGCETHWNAKHKNWEPGVADVIVTTKEGEQIFRCAEHYLRDIYRTGNGRWSYISKTGILSIETFEVAK